VYVAPSAACTNGRDSCHTCSDDGSHCTLCSGAKFLHDGICIDTCPDTYIPRGKGNFGLFCQQGVRAPACNIDHCFSCTDGACTKCRDAAYLHDGICLAGCPAGHEEVGTGIYSRSCVQLAVGCIKGRDNCHTCSLDGLACVKCSNSRYLLDGVCVDACPLGMRQGGKGVFGLFCIPSL